MLKIEQNNFAGLGTTGGGVAGASFTTGRVRNTSSDSAFESIWIQRCIKE